jgi:chorismate synthase
MPTLMYRTAGESHGPALIALIEGMPHGVPIDTTLINEELRRRRLYWRYRVSFFGNDRG